MGSFGMTCGVSGIRVDWGTSKVKLLFLAEAPFYDDCNPIYIHSHHQFCSYAMDATYEDYGNYEFDLESPQFKGFVELLKNHSAKIEEGENSCHDVPFDPKNPEHLKWEYLENAIQEGRVYLKGIDQKNHQISMFPIYHEVWDEICMKKRPIGWRGEMQSVEIIAKEFLTNGRGYDPDMTEMLQERIDTLEAKDELTPEEEMTLWRTKERINPINQLERAMGFEEFCGQYLHAFHTEQGAQWIAERLAEIRMVHSIMHDIGRPLQPVMYGGQDNMFQKMVDFSVGCAKIAQRLIDEDEDLGADV
jgi:hypothetical protein